MSKPNRGHAAADSVHPADQPQDAHIISTQWQGPLPPPSVLRGFDEIIEGGAERILRMAEKEQEHRISYETAELNATRRDFRRGQVLGTILAAACIAAAVYSVYVHAHPAVSIAMLGLPVMALIGKVIKK